jgi:hypothetical protein
VILGSHADAGETRLYNVRLWLIVGDAVILRSLCGDLSVLKSDRLVEMSDNYGGSAMVEIKRQPIQYLNGVRRCDSSIACSASYAGRNIRDSISRKRAVDLPADTHSPSSSLLPKPSQQPQLPTLTTTHTHLNNDSDSPPDSPHPPPQA